MLSSARISLTPTAAGALKAATDPSAKPPLTLPIAGFPT